MGIPIGLACAATYTLAGGQFGHSVATGVSWATERPERNTSTRYAAIADASASTPGPAEAAHAHDHHQRRHGDLLQGLGLGPTDRFQPWLAAIGRRLGHPNAVLPTGGLPRHRP